MMCAPSAIACGRSSALRERQLSAGSPNVASAASQSESEAISAQVVDARERFEFKKNQEAEQSVLGGILADNDTYQDAAGILDDRMFAEDRHRRIYRGMVALRAEGKAIDFITLSDWLKRSGDIEEVGGAAYVAGLTDGVPRASNVKYYAGIVVEYFKRREAQRVGLELIAGPINPALSIDDFIADRVVRLTSASQPASARAQQWRIGEEVSKERARVEARRIVASENAATATVKPNPIGLDELLARQFPPLEYAVDQLQPKGAKVLFAAQAKAGKTTAVINLIRSLADGEPFLNTFRPAPLAGRVCLLDLEMTERQLHHWFSQANIRNRGRVTVQQLRGKVSSLNILDPVRRSEWAAKLRELEISTLIFDNLRPLMDALGLDENSDAGRLLVAFDALVAEAGIGESMIVHHMGHNGNRSRGDSRLRDWPDVEWFLTRDKSPTGEVDDPASPRFFHAYGRDVDFAKNQLSFDPLTRRLTLIGGSPMQVKSDSAVAEIYNLIGDRELSGRGIESECAKVGSSLKREVIREALKAGLRAGNFVGMEGPKGAILHRRGPCAPSAPEVRQRASAVCAAPYIGARTRALDEDTSSAPSTDGGDHAPISI